MIERMHRRFLDVVRVELNRNGFRDISPAQAVMLSNIGEGGMSVRDLIERGFYLGSNASYNLKNLVEGFYVDRLIDERDHRQAQLQLTEKGKKVLAVLEALNNHIADPMKESETAHSFDIAYRILRKLEHRWSDSLHFNR